MEVVNLLTSSNYETHVDMHSLVILHDPHVRKYMQTLLAKFYVITYLYTLQYCEGELTSTGSTNTSG